MSLALNACFNVIIS